MSLGVYLICYNINLLSKDTRATELSHLTHELNTKCLSQSQQVDFSQASTLRSVHDFIASSGHHLRHRFPSSSQPTDHIDHALAIFYADVVERLCFKRTRQPSDQCIELILAVLTSKCIRRSSSSTSTTITNVNEQVALDATSRSMLVNVLFRNARHQAVCGHLAAWFDTSSFVGNNELFASAEEMAFIFQHALYDEWTNELLLLTTTNNNNKATTTVGGDSGDINEQLLACALEHSRQLSSTSAQRRLLAKLFAERKQFRKSYSVDFLTLVARLKFTISLFAKLVHNPMWLKALVARSPANAAAFDELNATLRHVVQSTTVTTTTTGSERQCHTLAHYLIKELVRKYGSASVRQAMGDERLAWIAPDSIVGNSKQIVDKYALVDYQPPRPGQFILYFNDKYNKRWNDFESSSYFID